MPILKQCSWHGCTRIVKEYIKYCDYHQSLYEREEKERYKEYRLRRADKKEQDFYNSKEWKRISDGIKAMQDGIDIFSYYILNKTQSAQTCHHIVELKEDWARRLDIDNLIGLTESNHQKIHKIYKKSNRDKKQMQKLLFDLIQRYYEEFRG